MHENRETSEMPAAILRGRPVGKGESRTAHVHVFEESDSGIVPMNHSNKSGKPPAESEEGRPLIKENTHQSSTHSTQSETRVSQGLTGVRRAARERKEMKFTALLHHLTVALLRYSFYALKRKAAPGVDGVTWQEYETGLDGRLADLHSRAHRGAYRAQPSRRVYIPKPDGRQRPLGVAALEDKIVQYAVVEILNQIYEEDFRGFSYGFRPRRSQHQALDALYVAITRKKVNWILDCDIRGFFDNLSHDWLLKFVQHRVADRRILRLIQKWLKAGVMEEGKWKDTEMGTPQGSVASPLLANIYLHYVRSTAASVCPRRFQNPTRAGAKRKNVSRPAKVVRITVWIHSGSNCLRQIVSGYARCHAVTLYIDRHRKCRPAKRGVFGCHWRKLQFFEPLASHG